MAVHELFTLVEQSDVEGLQPALAGKASQSDLDTLEGRVDGHDTSKANDDEVVHLTGDETITGIKTIPAGTANTWVFNGPIQVAEGTQLYHAARRGDLEGFADVDHTHDAEDVSAGTLDAARLPRLLWGTSVNTTTQVGSYNLDLSSIDYPVRIKFIQNHDAGLIAPTGGVDGQVVKVNAYANGDDRVFLFGSAIKLSSGLTSLEFNIPAGEVLIAAIEYSSDVAAWVLTAATVSG